MADLDEHENLSRNVWGGNGFLVPCDKLTKAIRAVEAINATGKMFSLNTWFRFKDNFYGPGTPVKPLKKVVESGILGWPLKVTISGVAGFVSLCQAF